jgi:hypothetical protein
MPEPEEDLTLQDAEMGSLGVLEYGSEVIEGDTTENRVRYVTLLDSTHRSALGACPPTDPHPNVPLLQMMTHISSVPRATPSLNLMTAIGRALALSPGDPGVVWRAYHVIVAPVLNMLREYSRLVPDYTFGTEHTVRGVSAIVRHTAPNAPPFPSYPFSEIDTFAMRYNNLAKQYPMRIGLNIQKRFDFACTPGCTVLTGMLPDGQELAAASAYMPVWFNTVDESKWSFGRLAPIDAAVTPFWSPMPDVMNARTPEFSVPDSFVMPNALTKKKVSTTRSTVLTMDAAEASGESAFSTIWNQDAYGNRIFLVPRGRIEAGACAYRVGRFVAKCKSLNDMYYAWQAEMGTFERVADGILYIPRQHVGLVFSHTSSMARMQFNNRAQGPGGNVLINGPHMQNFCGVFLAKFCVPAECPTSGYENGPWYCGVFGSFDGTLKSFLEGPDMEVHDIHGAQGENLRGEMLKYSSNGIVPYDMRFKHSHSHTPLEYWSRMVTYVHVMRDVLDDIDAVLKSNAFTMVSLCPENFVYDTRGVSLANVANALYLKHPARLDHDAVYFRTTGYDVALARRFQRRHFYNFKMLGIGTSCNFGYANMHNTGADAMARCLPLDIVNVRASYPIRHASDPFIPYNLVAMSSAMSPDLLASNRMSITCEQSLILARYVFFKMGLCDPDSYMYAAYLQASLRDGVLRLSPDLGPMFAALVGHAYDTHDMGLVFAHEPAITTTQNYPMFVIPRFISSMLTAAHPTPVSTSLNAHLAVIAALLSENSEFNEAGSDPANVPAVFLPGTDTQLNREMHARMQRLRDHIVSVIDIVNSTVPPESRTAPDQIDITPLK